jgi:hypothetical protein
VSWYKAPFHADWEAIRSIFIDLAVSIGKFILVILIFVFWVFMYIFSPIIEIFSLPIRIIATNKTIQKNEVKINRATDVRRLHLELSTRKKEIENLKDSNRILESEYMQKTVNLLERRIVELELGMTER